MKRNRRKISLLEVGIVVAIFGIVFCFVSKDLFVSFKEPVDIYQVDASDIQPGMHVITDIVMVWDTLYSETTTQTTYGIKTSERESARGYILPLCYVDDNGYIQIDKFIGLKVSRSSDYETVEKIMDETYSWWSDESDTFGSMTYPLEAKVARMDKDERELMEQYMSEIYGLSSAEAEEYILPYMLISIHPDTDRVFMIVGALLTLIGIVIIVIAAKRKKQQKEAAMTSYTGAQNADPYSPNGYGAQNADPYSPNGYGAQNADPYSPNGYGAQSADSYSPNGYGAQSADPYSQNGYGNDSNGQ